MKQVIFSLILLSGYFLNGPQIIIAETTYKASDFLSKVNLGQIIKTETSNKTTDGGQTLTTTYQDGSTMTVMPNSPNPPITIWKLSNGSIYQTQPGTTDQYVRKQDVNWNDPSNFNLDAYQGVPVDENGPLQSFLGQNQPIEKTPTEIQDLNWIVNPSDLGLEKGTDQPLNRLLNQLFYIGLITAVVLAIVMIIRGGVEYMTIDAITSKESGKKRVQAALGGLLLAFSAILILNTINPGLTSLSIKFEELKTIASTAINGGLTSGVRVDPTTGQVIPEGVVYRDAQGRVVVTENGVAKLDTDGSPGTYKVTEVSPDTEGAILINGKYYTSSGNTSLAMAGKPGNWWGVKTDNGQPDGNPIINPDGTMIPQLSWGNGTINGDKTPFVALSNGQLAVARQANPSFGLGQKVLLTANGKTIEATYADNRGNREDGGAEISPAAAQALGLKWGAQGGKTWIEGNVTITLPD